MGSYSLLNYIIHFRRRQPLKSLLIYPANLGDYLFDQIKLHFYRLIRDMLFDDVTITHSKLRDHAAVIGAASLLLEKDER